jgi:hypothetical protein
MVHQQAIHNVNATSDTKSFDLPFSALLGPLEIAEVYHSNHDVGTPFEISNHEGVDVSVEQGRGQVIIPDILGNITLEIIKCFAAFFCKLRLLPLLLPSLEIYNVVAIEFGGTRMRGRIPVKEQQSRTYAIRTSWRPRGANLVCSHS